MTIAACFHFTRGDFVLDCEFELPATGVSVIFGPSGCGKTTLLRAIAGLDRGAHGRLRIGSQTWQDEHRFLPAWQRPLGYVFQEASLFAHLTVRQNIEFGWKRIPAAERRIGFDQVVAWMGLENLLERRPQGLSGGERQRVALARALAVSPRLLLMDEPLASLDEQRKLELLPYLEYLHRWLEIPVLYVTHSMDELTRLADHLVLLQAGRTLACGAAAELLTRLDLPLASAAGGSAVLEGSVVAFDAAYQLATIETPCGPMSLVQPGLRAGTRVRLQVAARDVSLTLAPQRDTSILNIIPARVDAIGTDGPAQVIVRLEAGKALLLSRITRKSAEELGLVAGKAVYAQVKGIALLSSAGSSAAGLAAPAAGE